MQKYTHYWLLAAGCLGVVTFFVFSSDNTPTRSLRSQVATGTELCSDMVGYWKFDEGSGEVAADLSVNDNEAVFTNVTDDEWSASTAPGILFWNPYALDLPGNGHLVVSTGSNLEMNGDTTISLWANYDVLDATDDGNVLVAFGGETAETSTEKKEDNYYYMVNVAGSNNKLRMSWENGNDSRDIVVESSTVLGLSSGSWSHIVVVRDGSDKEVRFYEDGNLLGTAQGYNEIPSAGSGGKLFIGAAPHDLSATYFNGLIDDVRIYSKALTTAEVLSLHQNADSLTGCTCGNLEIEPPEECDDGNTVNTDSCTTVCTSAKCGDGYVQEGLGEECEPPGTATCSFNCTDITFASSEASSEESSLSIPPNCGNRIVDDDEGEECDEGHMNGKSECSIYCTSLYCGDGILSPEINEECEPTPKSVINGKPVWVEPTCGDACAIPVIDQKTSKVTGGCTRLFLPPCDIQVSSVPASSSSSSEVLKSAAPADPECGNDVLDEGEECDDGNTEDDDGCSALCTEERCGDGFIQGEEECDNGTVCTNDPEKSCVANSDCVEGERSGRCIYNYEADQTCTNACTSLTECGDGKAEGREECDDGNTEDGDGCSAICKGETVATSSEEATSSVSTEPSGPAVCGNFQVEDGEECDDGILNSDTESNSCRKDCTAAACGDAVIDDGEECDAGGENSDTKPDTCRLDCKLPYCGDGVRDSGEECDGGTTCSSECKLPSISVCGNGIVEGTEQCDDGNVIPGDGCNAVCMNEPKLLNGISSASTSNNSVASSVVDTAVSGEVYEFSELSLPSLDQYRSASSEKTTSVAIPVIPVSVAASSSQRSAFTLQPIQTQQLPQPQQPTPIQRPIASVLPRVPRYHPPVGDTGPGAVAIVTAGAVGGFLWKRRRRKKD